jgi:two-component system sensor histidine kinase/response regulator
MPHPSSYFGSQVLVVDDDPMNGELVKLRLAKLGLHITCAHDGNEAVALVKTQKYDLILMDVQMPNLDGVQATRQIRQLPNGFDVPILASTGSPSAQQRAHCLDAGMTDFIGKPFVESELLEAVLMWINPT